MSDSSNSRTLNHPAIKLLRRFFAEMNTWEWELIREDFSDLEDLSEKEIDAQLKRRRKAQRDKLTRIFTKYCESGSNAKRVNDALHAGGGQPNYNPDTEEILSVLDKGDRVIVETQMAHNFKFKLRYELVRTEGKWLIRDNRKCLADFNSKWKRWDL